MRGIGRRKGFTLVELLVVITIIGILAALVTVTVQPIQKRARDSKRRADITLVRSAADLFKADFKIYPNYTYYLGKPDTDGNPLNGVQDETSTTTQSYYDLGADLASCYDSSDTNKVGNPTNYALAINGSIASGVNISTSDGYNSTSGTQGYIKTKPGFKSVNHFLACLKYIDRVVTDPSAGDGMEANYNYSVSYDYSEILLSAQAENTNDKDSKDKLFTDGIGYTPKRFFEGNGVLTRQFDPNSVGASPTPEKGKYLYQCDGLSLDARLSTEPLDDTISWSSSCTTKNIVQQF